MTKRSKFPEMDREIGSNMRMYRNAAGLTQTQLGEQLGVTFQQVQKYETGFNRVAANLLPALSKILKCSPWDLLPINPQLQYLKENHRQDLFA